MHEAQAALEVEVIRRTAREKPRVGRRGSGQDVRHTPPRGAVGSSTKSRSRCRQGGRPTSLADHATTLQHRKVRKWAERTGREPVLLPAARPEQGRNWLPSARILSVARDKLGLLSFAPPACHHRCPRLSDLRLTVGTDFSLRLIGRVLRGLSIVSAVSWLIRSHLGRAKSVATCSDPTLLATSSSSLTQHAFLVLSCAATFAACGDRGVDNRYFVREAVPPTLSDVVFAPVGRAALDEDTAIINVSPRVTIDSATGAFVIADTREKKVRIYDSRGTIVRQFGSVGQGPGEFQRPMHALRIPTTGHVVVTDFSGLVQEFDSVGEFVDGFQLPIRPLYAMRHLRDQPRWLVSGIRLGSEDPRDLLHVWNSDSETVERSFFSTPGNYVARAVARNFGWTAFAVRDDTVAAVSALTDTCISSRPPTVPNWIGCRFRFGHSVMSSIYLQRELRKHRLGSAS